MMEAKGIHRPAEDCEAAQEAPTIQRIVSSVHDSDIRITSRRFHVVVNDVKVQLLLLKVLEWHVERNTA